MTFGQIIEEIEINSLLREAWLDEESEHYPVFEDQMRKELLVQLLMLLVIGGSLNQYDDNITEYRKCLKEIYKEVVSIRKEGSTGHVYLDSFVYELQEIDGEPLFEEHPQNKVIFVVSPSKRTCAVIKNKWVNSF